VSHLSKTGLPVALCAGLIFLQQIGRAGSVVTINSDKVMVINGRKTFPITLSPGPPTNAKTPDGIDALEELRSAGATMFRIVQTSDWNSELIATQQAALDWAAQHDMYCMVNLRELSAFAAGNTTRETDLRNIVNQFKNHPALGVWKNKDEAWWGGTSVEDLQRGYEVIKQEDTLHPVEQTHAPRGTVADLQPYNSAADIVAVDLYPIGYPPGANSLLTNKEISMIGDWTDILSQVANGQKQYWMIEQIAWSGVMPPAKTLRFPTFPQSRFMAYQAIIHGTRGLMFFGGNVAPTLNPQDAALGWNWTFWNNVLKPVVQEIGDKGLLADALVAPNSTLPIQVTGNVEFCARETSSNLYILACKREGVTTNVTFTGLPASVGVADVLYESPRIVTANNGQFSDWFAPFDVHVYRFALTNITQTNEAMFYEPFDYSNIGGPVTSNSPANWDLNGGGPNDLNVTVGSLSYAGLPASIGNSVTNGGTGLGVRRLFGVNVNSGKIYVSALFRINDLGYGAWNGGSTLIGALTATDNQNFRLSIMAKSNSPSSYVIGVQKGTGNGPVFDPTPHFAGETILLLGKYDFTTSPNSVSLWINPSASTFGGAEPADGFLFANTGADGFTIDRFNMRQNTPTSVPAAMQWDELRAGFSWSEVTPRAAPIAVTLTDVAQLENGTFQFQYSASDGQSFGIFASTNLTDWVPVGTATQIAPELYQFIDPAATNFPHRFYQLRAP
jgi:hypothetical protein